MSPYIHLLLVVSAAPAAVVAWWIFDLSPAAVASVTTAILGALFYICPLDLFDEPSPTSLRHRDGGNDVG